MADVFCKFCGETVVDPCADETDLIIYSRTKKRCFDASMAMVAEIYVEDSIGRGFPADVSTTGEPS